MDIHVVTLIHLGFPTSQINKCWDALPTTAETLFGVPKPAVNDQHSQLPSAQHASWVINSVSNDTA